MDIKKWEGDLLTIRIDYDKCKSHAECVRACPGEVYALENDKPVPVSIFDCIECCTCVEMCPEQAIEHRSCDEEHHTRL